MNSWPGSYDASDVIGTINLPISLVLVEGLLGRNLIFLYETNNNGLRGVANNNPIGPDAAIKLEQFNKRKEKSGRKQTILTHKMLEHIMHEMNCIQ